MQLRKYTVYMATNTVNGKRYVGITKRKFEIRKRQHLTLARNGDRGCLRFYSAIRKYGESAFTWKIIASGLTEQEAFRMERKLIKKIRMLSEEYNVTDGGEGGGSAANCGRKPIICLEDGKLFESITAAAKYYGISVGDVSGVCNGKRRSVSDRHFIYGSSEIDKNHRQKMISEMKITHAAERRKVISRNKIDNLVFEGKDRLGRSAAGPMAHSRKVICLDDLEIYPSASAAALHYDVARSALIELCLGKNGRRTVSGRRFCYLEDYAPSQIDFTRNLKKDFLVDLFSCGEKSE